MLKMSDDPKWCEKVVPITVERPGDGEKLEKIMICERCHYRVGQYSKPPMYFHILEYVKDFL